MSAQLDRVLAVLDVGLQSSGETGFGTDAHLGCSRCQREEPVEGGDLCAGCRAFLLEDSANDPVVAPHRPAPSGIAAYIQSERPRRYDAGGHIVIGGAMDGSCIAAEGRHLEVPIFVPMSMVTSSAPIVFERELYRRERFAMRDRLMWAWVHSSVTAEQAARRITHINASC